MEVKSNVKQRRMDRMKQLSQSSLPPNQNVLWKREELPYTGGPSPSLNEPLREPVDERWQDPEYVWNQRDRYRSERASLLTPISHNRIEYPVERSYRRSRLLDPPTSRQIWVKFGIAAVIFLLALGTFRFDHPLALKGRQWVTTALTTDYNFAAAAAWYESKFSGLPAILPASWRRPDPETQKASAVNARQLYAPVSGRIVTPYTVTDPMMAIETSSGEAKAIDAGRILAVTTGTDTHIQVVIQHANGLQSTYGGLSQTTVKKYDWIKGGEIVGQVAAGAGNKAGRLLFALKKDNQWIDPTEVVPFD
jgi:stage IV sporulation protein FA